MHKVDIRGTKKQLQMEKILRSIREWMDGLSEDGDGMLEQMIT